MQTATRSVKFSFNNLMYRQIRTVDDIAMDFCSLDLALANFFVDYYESLPFGKGEKPPMYYRYVDDTVTIFDSKK